MERPDEMWCPAAGKTVSEDVCYELMMGMYGQIKLSAIPEVSITDKEKARATCDACPYSNMD